MGLIIAPFSKDTEARVARDMNRLFNLFLPEVKQTIGAKNPEFICLDDFQATCLFYCLQGELINLRRSRVLETRNAQADFWQTEKITIWTTEVWLLLLAMEFQESGRILMINNLMREFFPSIFESSIIFGRDALKMLKKIEAQLPSGREIPEEAEELLMLI